MYRSTLPTVIGIVIAIFKKLFLACQFDQQLESLDLRLIHDPSLAIRKPNWAGCLDGDNNFFYGNVALVVEIMTFLITTGI